MAPSNVPADLGDEIYRLHDVDSLLSGLSALAEQTNRNDIKRISEVARKCLSVVRNNLDLIDIGRGAEVQHG